MILLKRFTVVSDFQLWSANLFLFYGTMNSFVVISNAFICHFSFIIWINPNFESIIMSIEAKSKYTNLCI